MANSKKHNFWYVVVMTNEGAKFITKLDYSTKYASWDKTAKPLEMSQSTAKDIAMGLSANLYTAFAVCSFYEIDTQPYRYDKGGFKWEWNEETEKQETENK